MAANTEAALIMQEAEQPAEPPAAPQEEEKPQRRRWRGPLQRYKEWVRAHPGLVGNLDLLSYLVVYNPLRSSSPGSVELTTEACHASVGLLSLWHQSIIDEEHAPVPRPAASLWLDAVEQVETIIELRGMHLEQHGRLSRYGPLTVVEVVKALLKLSMWSPYPGHLFLRHPCPEDLDQFESEQGLSDVLAALDRLRLKYSHPTPHTSSSNSGGGSTRRSWWRQGGQGSGGGAGGTSSSWFGGWWGGSGGGGSQPAAAVLEQGQAALPWPRFVRGAAAAEESEGEAAGGDSGGGGVGGPWPVPLLAVPVSQHARMGADLVWVGELLHIWRPVVYVSMLHRYGRGSWKPWCTTLALDLLSAHFTHRGKALLRAAAAQGDAGGAAQGAGKGGRPQRQREAAAAALLSGRQTSLLSIALARGLLRQPWSAGEVRELADRRRQLLMYLVRSPMLDWALRPLLETLRARTARVPLVGLVTDYAAGLLDTLTMYYSYTSPR